MRAVWSRGLPAVLLAMLLATLLAACGGDKAATLVTYQRDWPDGFHEELAVLDDGKVTMRHGDTLERLTLTGDQGDTVVRTVILANATRHSPVRVEPGSAVEMLEVLMTTHSLGGIDAQGVTPPPARSAPPAHAGHPTATP